MGVRLYKVIENIEKGSTIGGTLCSGILFRDVWTVLRSRYYVSKQTQASHPWLPILLLPAFLLPHPLDLHLPLLGSRTKPWLCWPNRDTRLEERKGSQDVRGGLWWVQGRGRGGRRWEGSYPRLCWGRYRRESWDECVHIEGRGVWVDNEIREERSQINRIHSEDGASQETLLRILLHRIAIPF